MACNENDVFDECSVVGDRSSFLLDLSQQSIIAGESRPTIGTKHKTPSKRLKERGSVKSRSNPQTPNKTGDRFIPDTSILNNDLVRFKLVQEQKARDETVELTDDKSDTETQSCDERFNILTDNLVERSKILNLANQNCVIGTASKTGFACSSQTQSAAKIRRFIPSVPLKVLDAPDLSTDFYLNLIDWSPLNFLAVALGSGVYMWDAATGETVDLIDFPANQSVTSIKFHDDGVYMAIGRSDGVIVIVDVETKQKVRTLNFHNQRVGSLAWNDALVVSGSRSGNIAVHDSTVRGGRPQHLLNGHSQEVCALKWNTSKTLLASGGSDSLVNIWNLSGGTTSHQTTSNYLTTTLAEHSAAVKAITWFPNASNMLATGGGSADKTIKLWNVNHSRCTKTVDTEAQVSQLEFSSYYNELISAQGYATNVLSIWKYPTLTKVKDLSGHTGRILHLCLSPDREVAATASDDETIRLWEVFAKDSKSKDRKPKKVIGNREDTTDNATSNGVLASSLMRMNIR